MLVRPKSAFISTAGDPNGYTLERTDILRDDNIHVKAYPDMFEPVAVTLEDDGFTRAEQATAAPGEKRHVRAR